MAKVPTATFKKVQVKVINPPPPSPDRPAAGIVQPDFAPQGNTSYHGKGKGKAASPKGGTHGLAEIQPGGSPQETE